MEQTEFINNYHGRGIKIESCNALRRNSAIPHILKYMGSKKKILPHLRQVVESYSNVSWFCDLFAGSGVVTAEFKNDFNIISNDIQSYSAILSSTYLSDLVNLVDSKIIVSIHEQACQFVSDFLVNNPEFSNFIDCSFTIANFDELENAQRALITKRFSTDYHLFTKFYSGTYWSFEQSLWIDALRAVAEKFKGSATYYAILSSLIFAMSYASQSTGHYAQYRDGFTDASIVDILNYRGKKIWPLFYKKFLELSSTITSSPKQNEVLSLDYTDCLKAVEPGTLVYADPPYQSVHYSRFYHVLETLVKYDYPAVRYKGRYRQDRHQSPFCRKSEVKHAFEQLFACVFDSSAHLILSYSSSGIISLDDLIDLSKSTLSNKYSLEITEILYKHSNMGKRGQKEQDVCEYLLRYERK